MNKKEVIKAISKKTGFSQKDVAEVVDTMIDVIVDSLKKGEEVNLVGFGRFTVQERAAREGVNPRDQKPIHISASRVPKFKAGKNFKEAIAI